MAYYVKLWFCRFEQFHDIWPVSFEITDDVFLGLLVSSVFDDQANHLKQSKRQQYSMFDRG
jgi:hypothetical protein